MSSTIKLLRTTRPKSDESLFGYIIRLTELNGYETPAWILKTARLNDQQLSQTGALLYKSHKNLKFLARVVKANLSELEPLTCPPAGALGSTPLYLFLGVPLPKFVIRSDRPLICPKCLLDTGYCHRIWDLIFVTVCPIHKCMLIDICPNCGSRIRWLRDSLSICRCTFDWQTACQPVKESELRVARHLYQICRLSLSGQGEATLSKNNPLSRVDLQGFVQLMVFIAIQYAGLKGKDRAKLKRLLNAELHPLFIEAFSVFENWPNRFYSFLDWCYERNASRLRRGLMSWLQEGNKKSHPSFYKELWASQFDSLREAVNSYFVSLGGANLPSGSKYIRRKKLKHRKNK